MSTIASPRDSSVNGRRAPAISTPTSSSRPSLEVPRSENASPNRAQQPRRNRAALREYYNLRKTVPDDAVNDAASEESSIHDQASEVAESEMDQEGFDGHAYIKQTLETQSLSELLRTYNGVLTDIRALDAEKKALVYDNYSKLIAATETIKKMRMNMDPLNPMASTLDPAIAQIYERAERIREELRGSLDVDTRKEAELNYGGREIVQRRRKTRDTVLRVLETPEDVRKLVKEDRSDDAKVLWEGTLRLLERWKQRGVGGDDVQICIEEGEAALRGEVADEKSWVSNKEHS